MISVSDLRNPASSHRASSSYAKISDILRDVEREWSAELGSKAFGELKSLLVRVWESPLTWPDLPKSGKAR